MKKKIITNILLIIFICIFLYSGYNIAIWVISDRKAQKIEDEVFEQVVTKSDENNIEEENQIKIDFEKLKDINNEIFAWIRIENTNINYPILQGETDEYYLKKDIYKKYNSNGSIFVYTNVNRYFEDDNTVIYGHNMKSGKMFADLHKINNKTLGTNVNIEIYMPNDEKIYNVFSVYVSEPNNDIIKKNFQNEAQKEKYIENAIKRSNVQFDITNEINYENNIITLITCDNNNKNRVIVNAIEQK